MEGFRRPRAVVLPDDALVSKRYRITPPPNQFTHQLVRPQQYYFGKSRTKPAGEMAAGTKVVLLVFNQAKYCRVADGTGLYVEIEYDSLSKL
jgi:hypothetical protein